jgi:hypothetical protein
LTGTASRPRRGSKRKAKILHDFLSWIGRCTLERIWTRRKLADDVRAKRRAVQTELDELRVAESSEQWESIQAAVESTWSELEAAFKKLAG